MVGKNKHQKQYLNHTQVIFKSSNTKSGIFGKVPHFWLSALITLERFNILQRGQKHDKIQAIWDQQTIKDIAESLFEFSVAMSCSFEKSPICSHSQAYKWPGCVDSSDPSCWYGWMPELISILSTDLVSWINWRCDCEQSRQGAVFITVG